MFFPVLRSRSIEASSRSIFLDILSGPNSTRCSRANCRKYAPKMVESGMPTSFAAFCAAILTFLSILIRMLVLVFICQSIYLGIFLSRHCGQDRKRHAVSGRNKNKCDTGDARDRVRPLIFLLPIQLGMRANSQDRKST